MLFNSFEFLFGLLPVSVAVYHFLLRRNFGLAKASLLIASLLFYAWWNFPYLALMLGSIAGNYISAGISIVRRNIVAATTDWSPASPSIY